MATDMRKAIKWYKSFMEALKRKGLDLTHKGNLARISLLPDLSEQQKEIAAFDVKNAAEGVPEALVDFLRRDRMPALRTPDKEGQIQLPPYDEDDLAFRSPINWATRNIYSANLATMGEDGRRAQEKDLDAVSRLYEYALEGRLNIYLGGEPAEAHTHEIYVDEEGNAAIAEMSNEDILKSYEGEKAKLSEREVKLGELLKGRKDTYEKIESIAEVEKAADKMSTKEVYDSYHQAMKQAADMDAASAQYRWINDGKKGLEGIYRIYTGPKPQLGRQYLADKSYLKLEYEVPKGVSEATCSAIIYGAMMDDKIAGMIETSSSNAFTESNAAFIKKNVVSNLVITNDTRSLEYGYLVLEGRKAGIEAIQKIDTEPDIAAKYLEQGAKLLLSELKVELDNTMSLNQGVILTLAKEIYQAISAEPFKSKVALEEEQWKLLAFSAKEAEVCAPYALHLDSEYAKRIPKEKRQEHLEANAVTYVLSMLRQDSIQTYFESEEAKEWRLSEIKKQAAEGKLDKSFLNFTKLDDLLDFNTDMERGDTWNPRILGDADYANKDRVKWEVATGQGFYQWVMDTPAEEVRDRMSDLVVNSSVFRYNTHRDISGSASIIRKYEPKMFRGIAPFSRYDVRNTLQKKMAAIEALEKQNPAPAEDYAALKGSLGTMLQYLEEHLQNHLTKDAIEEYTEKLLGTAKKAADCADALKQQPGTEDLAKIALDVQSYLQEEVQAINDNYAEYDRNKDATFEREMIWYKGFVKTLKEQGIDVTEALSLASVKIRKEGGVDMPAFLKVNEKGGVTLPKEIGEVEPLDYLSENTLFVNPESYPDTGAGLSKEEYRLIKALHEAADQGQLVIDPAAQPEVDAAELKGKLTNAQATFCGMLGKLAEGYRANPEAFAKKGRAARLANAELCGATWEARLQSRKRTIGLFSDEGKERTAEKKQLHAFVNQVLDADRFVWKGSPEYRNLKDAAKELEKAAKKLVRAEKPVSTEQMKTYREALQKVKDTAEAYLGHKAEPKNSREARRVTAAKQIAYYANLKMKGVDQTLYAKEHTLPKQKVVKAASQTAIDTCVTALFKNYFDNLSVETHRDLIRSLQNEDNQKAFLNEMAKTDAVRKLAAGRPEVWAASKSTCMMDVMAEISEKNPRKKASQAADQQKKEQSNPKKEFENPNPQKNSASSDVPVL